MYVKMVVLVRSFKGNFMSVCSYLQEVYDFNEVTLHMSKVLQSFLHRSKGYLKDEKSNQMRLVREKELDLLNFFLYKCSIVFFWILGAERRQTFNQQPIKLYKNSRD